MFDCKIEINFTQKLRPMNYLTLWAFKRAIRCTFFEKRMKARIPSDGISRTRGLFRVKTAFRIVLNTPEGLLLKHL